MLHVQIHIDISTDETIGGIAIITTTHPEGRIKSNVHVQTHHQRHLHLQPASLVPWITFIQTRDLLCSAPLCPNSAVGYSVLFRPTDKHPLFGMPSQSKKQNAKRSQSNRGRERRTTTPQFHPTHRYRQQNKTISTTRRPNPTRPRRNAPRPSTTARQSSISMRRIHTYAHRYTLACIA
jgi:hypothetical protein